MILFLAGAAALSLASCGSKKSAAETDYQYQQWLAQQQANNNSQQTQVRTVTPTQYSVPTMVKEEQPECVTLSFEPSPNLRAYGEGSGFYDDGCDRMALQNALEKLTQLIEVKMRTATESFSSVARENLDASQKQKLDQLTRSLAQSTARNTRIIKRETFRLSNGHLRVYLCVETQISKDGLAAQAANALGEANLLKIDAEKARFRDIYSEILNDFGVQPTADPTVSQ